METKFFYFKLNFSKNSEPGSKIESRVLIRYPLEYFGLKMHFRTFGTTWKMEGKKCDNELKFREP
jgi:hypothetical protein